MADTSVDVSNTFGPIGVDADSTVEIKGLNDIKLAQTLSVPQPIKTESKQELILPQPFRTESRLDTKSEIDLDTKSDITVHSDGESKNALSVDLKPVALDVCATLGTKLPHGEICQPFNLHFGLTWFGMELLGFNFGGESRTILQDIPKKPAVDWPAQQNTAPRVRSGPPASTRPASAPPAAQPRGLRVRIK